MKTFFALVLITTALTLSGCGVSREIPAEVQVYAPNSDLIFQGTVIVLHTSTIDAVDAEPLGVVNVGKVFKSPEYIGEMTGKDITIHFKDMSTVNPGDNYVFFSNPYFIGDEIAVMETGRMSSDDQKTLNTLPSDIAQVNEDYENAKLKERVESSQVIVYGNIKSIKVITSDKGRDSEHDPQWAEATVEVEQTIKGNPDVTVTFIFASSTDVAWVNSPKFREGDKGVYLLRESPTLKELRGRFVMFDMHDFYTDKSSIDKIKSLSK